MAGPALRARLLLALLALLLTGLLTPAPITRGASDGAKTLLDADNLAGRAALEAAGARLLFDYGAFSLWRLPPGATLAASLPDDFDTIYLRGQELIPGDIVPAVSTALRQRPGPGGELWMLQFAGPIRDEWLDELRAINLTPVAYMPNHAYVVWGDQAAREQLGKLVEHSSLLEWSGPYHPAYRLSPALQALALAGGADSVEVSVDVFRAKKDDLISRLAGVGGEQLFAPFSVGNLTSAFVRLPASALTTVAAWPDLFNVSKWQAPEPLDERQNQYMAGNIEDGELSGPGYLAWLEAQGLPADPAGYPVVAVVDSGLDNGRLNPAHPAFYQGGDPQRPTRVTRIVNCTRESDGADSDGHGTINAGIVAGYSSGAQPVDRDEQGYALGLGVAPQARLAAVKVFDRFGFFSLSGCGGSFFDLAEQSVELGATISTNSWGSYNPEYDSLARFYDSVTRDANAKQAGNQELLHIFSAGNAGPDPFSILSPSVAKNVVTVGATESLRPEIVVDGCGVSNGGTIDALADFSSRGPSFDKRAKPDLVAPGAHIVGPATQSEDFNGSGVCALPYDDEEEWRYYPPGQTLYTVSSGTSHSAPAVAGAAALFSAVYRERWRPGFDPSPAMLKALLLHQPRYINSLDRRLPGFNQGWGALSLAPLISAEQLYLFDQAITFDTTGQSHLIRGQVADPARPLAITLTWSDAPGSTSGAAYVNDLNLIVTVGGVNYLGNVFSGGFSASGGRADNRNNVERVVLPAGLRGPVSVRVVAANLAGDALPANGDLTDQDFALVATNLGSVQSVSVSNVIWSEREGDRDGALEPGEVAAVQFDLINWGDRDLNGVSGNLRLPDGNTVLTATASYPTLPASHAPVRGGSFVFRVGESLSCGALLRLDQTLTSGGATLARIGSTIQTGAPSPPIILPSYGRFTIPDYSSLGSTLEIEEEGRITDINVRVDIVHPWVGDLAVELLSPEGGYVVLINQPGQGTENGANLRRTVFDDEGVNGPISAAVPPYSGRFTPVEPLSLLDGQELHGTWYLVVNDYQPGDEGELAGWSLEISTDRRVCEEGERTYMPLIVR